LIFSTPTSWNLNQTEEDFRVKKERKKTGSNGRRWKKQQRKKKTLKSINFNVRLLIKDSHSEVFFSPFHLVRVAQRSSVCSAQENSFNPNDYDDSVLPRTSPCNFLFNYANSACSKKRPISLLCVKRREHEHIATSWVENLAACTWIEFIPGGNLRDTKNWW
jgi:hypothetical protein